MTENLIFTIPINKEDLLIASNKKQFVVEEVFTTREIPLKVQDLKKHQSSDLSFIFEDFNTYYSVISRFSDLNEKIKIDALETHVKTLKLLEAQLLTILDGNERLGASERLKHTNMIKMVVYIAVQLVDCFEVETNKPSEILMATGKGRKKGQKSVTYENLDWESEKLNVVNLLQQLCILPIKKLWDPPIVEEDLINLINNCCFKVMENLSFGNQKNLKETVFQLLGNSLKSFGHSLGLSLKIIQLLQQYQHLVLPLAEAVTYFVTNHGSKILVTEIVREIARLDSKDLQRDSSGTKSLSQFLIEMAELSPTVFIPSISLLLAYLDTDPYGMRICVLTIFEKLVLKTLSEENMDLKSKELRDQLLDKLEDHILDAHAFVRSKNLQIWQRLCAERIIPLGRQHELLKLITGRLLDKSSQVRKHAILFMTAFLQGNPFTARLTLEELQLEYEKEKKKLQDLMSNLESGNGENEPCSKWDAVEFDIKQAIDNNSENSESSEEEESDEDSDKEESDEDNDEESQPDSDLKKFLKVIMKCLKTRNYTKVLKLVQKGKKTFSDSEIFCAKNIASDETSDEEDDETSELKENLFILKKIYIENETRVLPMNTSIENISDINELQRSNNSEQPIEKESNVNDISKQQVLVRYLKDCTKFSQQVHEVIPTIAKLLSSKTTSDILEAISFFVTAYEFGVKQSVFGIRKMLLLVWSKETAVKDAVVNAYKQLYLNPKPNSKRSKAEEIVYGLSNLSQGLTLGELTSLEELISEFVKNKEISKSIFNTLWQKFSSESAVNANQSHAALVIIGMTARFDPDIVKQNLDLLITNGLGNRAKDDFLFAKDVCVVLLKLSGTNKPSIESKSPPFRLEQNHEIFIRLQDIILEGFEKKDKFWVPFSQQAVKVIYKLAEHPDLILQSILFKMLEKIEFKIEENNENESVIPSFVLLRFSSFLGDIALTELVHLDIYVFSELKRRVYLKEQNKETKQKNRKPLSAIGNKSRQIAEGAGDATVDIEMGLVGAVCDDTEADFIAKVCETELLADESLLGKLSQLLINLCTNPAKYADIRLRTSAAMALAKCMMISSSFCESQLSLLITIMEKSPEPCIRANTIIALGDLAVRFPNMVEPWTPHLYACLRDNSAFVRKNTLSVLTHLILNDLIKVKSQISDLALCVVDKDLCISSLAKTFFHELAKKGNSVYNVLPDIISHLSDPDCGTTEENFQIVLKYLISFVEKDRYLEQLVEKLCLRFNSTVQERQDRDLAFCLSLIPFNERCLRKLQENAKCFAEKMRDKSVYNFFISLLNATRKKSDSTDLLDEVEQLINEFHMEGMSEENMLKAKRLANKNDQPGAKSNKSKKNTCKSVRKRKYSENEDSPSTEMLKKKGSVCGKRVLPSRVTRQSAIRMPLLLSDSESD